MHWHKHYAGNFCRKLQLHLEIMTFSASKLYIVFMFLILYIIIFLFYVEVKAGICKIAQNTRFSYGCHVYACHVDCISSKHADYGACKFGDIYFSQCLCYFTCWTMSFCKKKILKKLKIASWTASIYYLLV